MLWWQPFAETPMNGLGMKHGNAPSSRPTGLADLAEGREVVGRLLGPVEAEIELELARSVLVITPDHVEPHRLAVLDHPVDERLELGELVDVVAEGLGHALDGGRAVVVELEPHHLGLGAGAQVETRLLLEVGLDPLEVAAAVGGQKGARVLSLLPVSEAGTPDPSRLRVPGQRRERVGLRHADELRGLGAVADVVSVAVGEEVGRRAVDELEAFLAEGLPVVGRDALAHDPSGDRRELVVDVRDSLGLDARADILDELAASPGFDEAFEIGRHLSPPLLPVRCCRLILRRRGG